MIEALLTKYISNQGEINEDTYDDATCPNNNSNRSGPRQANHCFLQSGFSFTC
jgi:hypothetical protein